MVAVALAASGSARAQMNPGSIEAGICAGRLYGGSMAAGTNAYFDDTVRVDDGILNGFWLAAQLSPTWGLEAAVRRTETHLVEEGHGTFPSEPQVAGLDLATVEILAVRSYRLGHFLPYLGGGAGVANLDINTPDPARGDSDKALLVATGGARFAATPWLGFRFDLRIRGIYLGERSRGHDGGWNDSGRWLFVQELVAGVYLAFGGS